jgi:hypothetical protein
MDVRTLLTLACLLGLQAAHAQNRSTPPPRPTAIPLAEEPVRLESAGLKLLMPEGVVSQVDRAGRYESIEISPPPPDQTWAVTVKTPRSAKTEITPTDVAGEALKQLLASVGVQHLAPKPQEGVRLNRQMEHAAEIIEEVKPLVIEGCEEAGARFYVRLARGAGETPAVRGYSVFRAAPGHFVVFELFTTDDQFDRARPLYEIIVARAEFDHAGDKSAARQLTVEAGLAVLSGLTPEDFSSIISTRPEQLLRTFREAPGGADADATEIGYQRIRVRSGHRGELDRTRDKARWDDTDRQEGYIVTIEARTILREENRLVDSLGTYFMTPDRAEEAWTLQMAIRDGSAKTKGSRDATGTWFETGARSGRGMTITVTGKGQVDKNIRPMVPDRGYLTQVEMLLLPQVLMRAKQPGEFGFYTYQSSKEAVALRLDKLTESPDRPGLWTLTTRVTEDAPPRLSLYTERGELIRATLPDKTVVEPISKDRLLQLWKSKGLPMN